MKTLLRSCLVLTLLATPLVSCSKKDGDSATQTKALSQSLLDDQLLQRIPNTTAAFHVVDFSGEGYKKLITGPWTGDAQELGILSSAIEALKSNGASEEQVKVAQTILDSFQRLGLVTADGKPQVEKVLSSSVAYLAPQTGQPLPLDVGVFARAASGVSIADRVSTLKQILTEAGLTVSDEKIGGAAGFVAQLPDNAQGGIEVKLYVAGTADKVGIALSKSSLEGLLGTTDTSGLANLKALPEFSKASDAIRTQEPPLSVSFASIKLLAPLVESLQDEGDDLSLKENPIAAVAMGQGYSNQMVTTLGVVVSPATDAQKSVFAAFEGSGLSTTALKLPTDTAASLALDARILGKLETVLKDANDPSADLVVQQLKTIQGLTLGLRNSDGSSPMPDVYLTLDSSTRDQVASSLEAGIGLGMMATGQQLQWLSKEIAGNPTRYFLTPLGVGVYVSSPKSSNSLIIATSERAVKDIAASEGTGASLDTSMSRTLRDKVTAATSFCSFYFNFPQIGNLLDSVKATATSMMGPNPELEQALDSTRLKKLGTGVGSLSYANGVFKFQSVVERVDIR